MLSSVWRGRGSVERSAKPSGGSVIGAAPVLDGVRCADVGAGCRGTAKPPGAFISSCCPASPRERCSQLSARIWSSETLCAASIDQAAAVQEASVLQTRLNYT
jgi:hypothetical protein